MQPNHQQVQNVSLLWMRAGTNKPRASPPGLIYVSDTDPGYRRQRAGKGFARKPDGTHVKAGRASMRIKTLLLSIPPHEKMSGFCSNSLVIFRLLVMIKRV